MFSFIEELAGFHDLTFPDHKSPSPCQIDHIAIGRLSDVIVFETKSAVNGMYLDPKTGAWSVSYNGTKKPVPSPIEQNRRHIEVLAYQFKESDVYPRRLGIPVRPRFHSWILVQPGVSLPPSYNDAWIVQRDQIDRRFDEFLNQLAVTEIVTFIGPGELEGIGMFLESFKSPTREKEAPTPNAAPQTPGQLESRRRGTFCDSCGTNIDPKVAAYCRVNFKWTGNQYLCRECQRFLPK